LASFIDEDVEAMLSVVVEVESQIAELKDALLEFVVVSWHSVKSLLTTWLFLTAPLRRLGALWRIEDRGGDPRKWLPSVGGRFSLFSSDGLAFLGILGGE